MTTTKKKLPASAAPRSGLGLDVMGDLSALLEAPAAPTTSGGPLALDLGVIDEDPHQPRTPDNPGFSAESLDELAASILLRGVKTPISVRNNPEAPGRFIVNHGARRLRASKIARKTHIPAFIDDDYNEADQVVENLQRDALTPREIADYIGRELAKGLKKGAIAKAISKSPAFVSQHVTLLDLPEPIATAFNSGRARDVTVVNELVTAFKGHPSAVADWLANENQEVTRGTVKELREYLDDDQEQTRRLDDEANDDKRGTVATKKAAAPEDPEKLKRAVVQVLHDKRAATLFLNRRPAADGYAWLKYDDDGEVVSAELAQMQLVALLEG